jgi:hypothetical protein
MLLAYITDALSGELPSDLVVRAEEHVTLVDEGETQSRRPDLAIIESWRHGLPPVWQPEETEGSSMAVAEPLIIHEPPEPERWLEIRDATGELITVIELLSPVNKAESGWLKYRAKQDAFIAAGVNRVEIDLVFGGSHVTAVRLDQITFPPGTCHHICVSRARLDPYRREVYFCPLREPLPNIRVPLRLSDPDIPLALQPLIDRCYQTGRYWLTDHSRAPLCCADADREWIAERMRAAGLAS